jgi:hypothetical protein
MPARIGPGFEHEDVFWDYCCAHGAKDSARSYRSFMNIIAAQLAARLGPASVRSENDVQEILGRISDKKYTRYEKSNFKSVLRKYVAMVRSNFGGHFAEVSESVQQRGAGHSITPLSPQSRQLLKAILDFIGTHKVVHTNPSTYPSYEQMYHAVVPTAPARVLYVGHNLRKKGLDELNVWTTENQSLPKITGLVVSKSPPRPSDSFFTWYGKQPFHDDAWWQEEVRKSLEFDWSLHVGTQQAASPPRIADDTDEDQLAPRAKGEVFRIIRDTKIVRDVKALHDHTCQLCGLRLELSPGVFYSEAHHLKPLGKPHHGPDKKANVVCVCPNCHVKLDFHAIRIQAAQLKPKADHTVNQKFIDHHNGLCS